MENSVVEYRECLKRVFDCHIAKMHIASLEADDKTKELLSFSKDFNARSIEKGDSIKSKFRLYSRDFKMDLLHVLSDIYSEYYNKFQIELAA